jgi:hypothetical protein
VSDDVTRPSVTRPPRLARPLDEQDLRGGRLHQDDGSPSHWITRSSTSRSPAPLLRLRGRAGRRSGSPSQPQVSLRLRRPERGAAEGAPSSAQGRLPILSACAEAWEAPSPGAVSALQSDGHARRSRRDGAGTRQAPAESWLHGVRGPLSGACSCARAAAAGMRPWSTRLSVPISLAPELRVAPGQPDRWTLNTQVLKPALSSTNGHQHRSRQLDSIRTFSPILATPPVTCGLGEPCPVGEHAGVVAVRPWRRRGPARIVVVGGRALGWRDLKSACLRCAEGWLR